MYTTGATSVCKSKGKHRRYQVKFGICIFMKEYRRTMEIRVVTGAKSVCRNKEKLHRYRCRFFK